MAGPSAAVPEDHCRDAIIALTHNEVCKSGYLIHHCFLGYLQDVPEQVGIAPEIPDSCKAAPADRIAGLAAPERPAAGIRDDDADIFLGNRFYIRAEICCCLHRVRRKEDHHTVLNITLINARPDPDMAECHFREDERVFQDDVGRGVENGLNEAGILSVQLSQPHRPFGRSNINEFFSITFGF